MIGIDDSTVILVFLDIFTKKFIQGRVDALEKLIQLVLVAKYVVWSDTSLILIKHELEHTCPQFKDFAHMILLAAIRASHCLSI